MWSFKNITCRFHKIFFQLHGSQGLIILAVKCVLQSLNLDSLLSLGGLKVPICLFVFI